MANPLNFNFLIMKYPYYMFLICFVLGCSSNKNKESLPFPIEIIDLGTLVTEDLPERTWGGLLEVYGFNKSNSFEVINQKFDFPEGSISVNNSYLTIFNHGGPHVDAPNHVDRGGGIDSYSINDFIGPLKVIDASKFPYGRSVPRSELEKHDIQPGDIILIYTDYSLPDKNEIPQRIALTQEAAEYLANIPVKGFGTDSFNVESDDNPTEVISDVALQRVAPIHYEFLSRGIPIFEQLFNVDKLLRKKNMIFIGQPLNIENGDGMIVRPVVFIYE